MLRLSIDLGAAGDALSGFELGHLTFEGDRGSCTSKSDPALANMVFLSVVHLLDGIQSLLSSPGQREYEFGAIDSSFIVWFYKTGKDALRVECRKVVLTEMNATALCRSLLTAVQEFQRKYAPRLAPDAAARHDLEVCLAEFARFVAHLPAQ